ncbi:MAG: ArsR/SmtB family transcription factor [Planctomycetota bacterium]|jgi:DNA-binding transcriptional ArsR family regulator
MGLPAEQFDSSEIPPVRLVWDADDASNVLHPMRRRLLESLDEPKSAAGLARELSIPRQKIGYHLRALEGSGLVSLHSTRRVRNCEERLVMRSARSYLISPEAIGPLGDVPPEDRRDRFSWAYLVGAAGRVLRDLTTLRRRADNAGQQLATFTLETEARIGSPAQLNEMLTDISNAVADAVRKHHDENHPDGRVFRVVLGSYPKITKDEDGNPLQQEQAS